jgi:hypothetical protein
LPSHTLTLRPNRRLALSKASAGGILSRISSGDRCQGTTSKSN